MTEVLSLRPATADDAGTLAEIHAACFAKGWPARDFARYAAGPDCLCLLAEAGSEAAGFVLCRRAGPEAEILSIAVPPARRRQGIGRSLCEGAISRLHGLGVTEIFLEVEAENAAAIALYESFGFARTGIRKGYYRSSGAVPADAVTMRLDLT